jgi:hypothetical protein
MKWGSYSNKVSEKTTKLLNTRGGYYLLIILGLALAMGASVKWRPDL